MKIKRTLCLLFAVLLLLISAGCGGPASNQADTDAVKAAVDKFRACESFTLSQITEIEETVTAEGMSYVYSGINEMQLQLITKPEFSVMTQTTMSQEFDGEQKQQRSGEFCMHLFFHGGILSFVLLDGRRGRERTDLLCLSYHFRTCS